MNIHAYIRRGFVVTGLGALLALPVAAASTPLSSQGLLNAAIQNAARKSAHAIAGEISIHVTERPLAGGTPTLDASADGLADLRITRPANGIADTQGSLRLRKATLNGLTTDQPMEVDWKQLGNSAQAQANRDPSTQSMIASGVQNALASLNAEQIAMVQSALSSALGVPTDISAVSVEAMTIAQTQPLTVRRIEKRYKAGNGNDMIRLRAAINPAIANAMQTAELAKLDRTASDYWTQRAAVLARYRTMRTQVNGIFFAININATTQMIERIEIGTRSVTPVETCAVNSAGKNVCRKTANRTVELGSGFFVKSE